MAELAESLDLTLAPQPIAAFDRERVEKVALKAFFNLAKQWDLGASDCIILLGNPSERTYYRWREGKVSALPDDTLERISVMLGIYKAIQILLPVNERANQWLKRPNSAFGGATALELMLKGRVDHLYQVRRHLDAWRG